MTALPEYYTRRAPQTPRPDGPPVPPVEALPPVPRAARRGGGTGDPRPGAGCREEPASGHHLGWRTWADRVGGWLLYAALFASTAYLVCLGAPVVGRLIAARLF